MLFFQLLLFAGYLYAHLLRTWFRPAMQGIVHLLLLCGSLDAADRTVGCLETNRQRNSHDPPACGCWPLTSGLPYFVLSSTGPLVQAWLSYHDNSHRVYRLYALSNAGSLGSSAQLSVPGRAGLVGVRVNRFSGR